MFDSLVVWEAGDRCVSWNGLPAALGDAEALGEGTQDAPKSELEFETE